MSAVPKKKLCWNCEGNIAKQVDNCPYCGVYVHSPDLDENNGWNIPYASGNKKEEIPTPFYQIHENNQTHSEEDLEEPSLSNEESQPNFSVMQQLKEDVLPILLLMSGSIFFLFGIVLFLFSTDGKLILEWNGNLWPYFLALAVPFVYLGWKYLLRMDQE
jgi:hypothetical protein